MCLGGGADGEGLGSGDAQAQERGELVAWAHWIVHVGLSMAVARRGVAICTPSRCLQKLLLLF